MASRYSGKEIVENQEESYKKLLEKRNLKVVKQYSFSELSFPDAKQLSTLTVLEETWVVGSRLYKLAHKHYGDSSYWWVIGWFNKKPTEADYELGDIVYVPLPLSKVLSYAGL